MEEEGRRGHLGELAGRRRRQGQRGRRRVWCTQTPGLDRLRRADLRAAEQDRLRLGAERRPASSCSASIDVGDRGRGRRGAEHARRTSASRSPTRPARASIRSRRSPGCCSTRIPKDKAQARSMVDFMKWALTDGQKFAAELGYAPLPADGRQARDGGARRRSRCRRCAGSFKQRDVGFRLLDRRRSRWSLIVLVVGDRLRAGAPVDGCRSQKFGLNFWRTEIWDPVSGEFGALPFIWGTLYSSVLALLIATPIALGIAVFISELCPAWLRQPLVFLTELLAAIPSIVYGLWGIFVLVPAVRALETAMPDCAAAAAALHRPAARRRHAVGGADPRDHGDPVHLVGRARGAEGGAGRAARRRLRARRDALRGDPRALCSTRAPASSARSCSASAARSARRWR